MLPQEKYKYKHILLHESITSNTSNGVGPQVLPTLVTALPVDKFTEVCRHIIMATHYYFIPTKLRRLYQTYLLSSSIKTYIPIHFLLNWYLISYCNGEYETVE